MSVGTAAATQNSKDSEKTFSVTAAKPRILIVGAGLTGCVLAHLLRQKFKDNVELQMWENSRGVGGRMATTRRSDIHPQCQADLGFQVFFVNPTDYEKNKKYLGPLQSAGHLKIIPNTDIMNDPLPEFIKCMSPQGSNAMVKYFLQLSGVTPKFQNRLQSMTIDGGRWKARTDAMIDTEADCVVLTMPIPYMMSIQGHLPTLFNGRQRIKQELLAVTYSCRFTLILFYKPDTTICYDWIIKFLPSDPCIQHITIDHVKRGFDASVGPSIVIHGNPSLGTQLIEADKEVVCKYIMYPRIMTLLPDLPEPFRIKCHKWRQCQVIRSYTNSPGAVLLTSFPPTILTGDGFSGARAHRCFHSAEAACQLVSDIIVKLRD